ncbi:Fungal-trans domain-containing protein [Mycena venus]|uniref:Fungal-trans domain-containing protein n=1 Tax=Mycena venus TaxID=2733690 RepID=A0A8H7D4B7_9AGAR|nr:Fungal-trans domain-containing protein [Mycena venus]
MALPPSVDVDFVTTASNRKKYQISHVFPAAPVTGCDALLSGCASYKAARSPGPSRMLPFGLKLAWFALSLSGLIGCWAVLLPLAWAIQSYWGPIAYAVGITVLEGIFCLGMVWRMNPANTPRAFCLAQVLLTGLVTFFLIGVLAAITTATTIYIAKPKQWNSQNETAILPWRFHYLLPMMLFPLLASAVHITFVIFFDTFEPFDGFTCVARPLWIRFLGYAGTPFLITIPCLWLSLLSAVRVIRTHNHIRRARRSVNLQQNLDHFTALPQKKSKQSMKTHSTPPTPRAITSPSPTPSILLKMGSGSRRQPISPVLREDKVRSYHLPFLLPPPSPDYITAYSGSRSRRSEDSFDTVSSVSFAEMTSKSPTRSNSNAEEDDVTTPLRSVNTPNGTTRSTHVSTRSIHNSDRISIAQLAFAMQREEFGVSSDYYSYPSRMSSISGITPTTQHTEYRSPSELSSVVRSLLIFQFAIILTHLVSAITPIVDIISARSHPAAFGTQHVALLLAGWAPVAIFGPLSVVRRHLKFWR